MTESHYSLGTYTAEQYTALHNELTSSTDIANVPDRVCSCSDEKEHSPTRGCFLLTEDEATALKNDPRVLFINIDYLSYPETYAPPPDELHASVSPSLLNRWGGNVKVYKEFEDSNTLPSTPTSADWNRTGYQILRGMYEVDPWINDGVADDTVKFENITQLGDGIDVDVIVADDGAGWIGHPEFQNNCEAPKPDGYTGGNLLPGEGTCDVLDLVLDAPYYLDPDYFNADPDNRLTTRWDGTIVPVETHSRNWWSSSLYRSSAFKARHPGAGYTSSITTSYTRSNCNGSNTAQSLVGEHCTPCMALTYGRTQGWAYNANKWVLNLYGTYGSDIERGFDIQKIFHQTKPVNRKYGTQDPTVCSNSWGYRASKGTTNGYYHFRDDDPVQYGGVSSEPAFISGLGSQGDAGRWKSEMKTNSITTALDEMIAAGVIFVAAAGNSNQPQMKHNHPDYMNYVSALSTDALEDTSYFEFSVETTGSTNRRGFPQQGGKYLGDVASFSTQVTNLGTTDWVVTNFTDRQGTTGGSDPTITIHVGDTLTITNNATSTHPLYFKTAVSTGPGDQVTGATGQGAFDGTDVVWTPTEPGLYYYQCGTHLGMSGEIRVWHREVIYPVINVGALNDQHATGPKERKVSYSDRGNDIDVYAPADGTLAANRSYTPEGRYPDTYPGFTANSGSGAGVPEETGFSGTSAACPVAAGFISTLVGLNRNWGWREVKDYLESLNEQSDANFYKGSVSTSATDANWLDYDGLEGGRATVMYQDANLINQTTFPKRQSKISNGLKTSGITINYINKFDRGR